MRYMFRFLIRLVMVTAIFAAVFTFGSSGKVLAAGCPSGGINTVPSNWGVTTHEHSKAMAGMIVRARDADTGNNLNVGYKLRSSLPGVTSGEIGGLNPNDQIFSYPIGTGRTSQRWFDTGKKDIYQYKGSSTGAQQCTGWSVVGPGCYIHPIAGGCNGNTLQRGNHFVLNCGVDKIEGDGYVSHPSRFWISEITKPAGQDGRWEIRVGGTQATDNSSTNPMNGSNNYFTVGNGYSKFVELIWHKKKNPPAPPVSGDCNVLSVGSSKYTRRLAQVYGVDLGRTRTFENDVRISNTKYGNHQADGGTYFSSWVLSPPGSGNVPPGSYKRIWNYKPVANSISIQVYEYKWNGASWIFSHIRNQSKVCFKATCTITSVTGDAPGGRVRAGGPMTVRGTFRNISPDGNIIWNQALKASGFNVGSNNKTYTVYSGPSYVGYTYDFSIGMTATSSITADHFNLTPVYYNNEAIGSPCSDSISGPGDCGPPPCHKTYKQFDLSLSGSTILSPTREDPDVSRHRAKIESDGPTVKVPYTARSTLNGGNINTKSESATTTINYAYDHIDFSSIKAGDEFCTQISTPNGSGWVGPGYELVDANHPKNFGPTCDTVHDRPYLSVYGGDAVAGVGGFYDTDSASCGTNNGGIRTYTNVNSDRNRGGSGSQLAALSNGDISGFSSASMTAAPLNLKLSFANTVNRDPPGSGDNDNENNLGGRFNQSACTTNYFNATQYPKGDKKQERPESSISPNSGTLADGEQTLYKPGSGKANLHGASNYSKKHTVYVNGDVVIRDNIVYRPWSSISDIPNFTLIVKGNIYIQNTVSRLDGLYIAQPKSPGDSDSGNIYTCTQSNGNRYPIANLDASCDNQLTVYGSLVAERIRFLRTYKTLRNSIAKDEYPGLSVPERIKKAPAAEKIIYTPELYLSPPIFNVPGSVSDDTSLSSGIYESVTTLPPIL